MTNCAIIKATRLYQTDFDLQSVESCIINLKAIALEIVMTGKTTIYLKNHLIKIKSKSLGYNELIMPHWKTMEER